MKARASVVSLIFLGSNAFANMGLTPIASDFKAQNDSFVGVTNMPKVRSQDSMGVCYAFAASTLIDEANCVAKKIQSCSTVSDDDRVSPLDMSRFSQKLSDDNDKSDRFNYEGLQIDGGGTGFALYNGAFLAGNIVKESCAPFDQIVAKTAKNPDEARNVEEKMWTKLKNAYESYKNVSKECATCGAEWARKSANEIIQEYGIQTPPDQIAKAFAQETYNKFLDMLLIPDKCWDLKYQTKLSGNWKLNTYPPEGEKSDFPKILSKIKEVLGQKRPIGFSLCTESPLQSKTPEECGQKGFGHAVVIKGYRRVCNSANKCYDALQVQNSWGQSWQDSTNDGWVDAKDLLDHSLYTDRNLTWLSPKQ